MTFSAIVIIITALSIPACFASSYDEKQAYRAINYAIAAYCSYETLDDWSCGSPCFNNDGVSNITRINQPEYDLFAFIAYDGKNDNIIISFRGTNGHDIMNWITNLDHYQIQYKNFSQATVHRGFQKAYETVQIQLLKLTSEFINQYPKSSIVVTGHSLGGALAHLAALDIKTELKPSQKLYLYTFGQPRVGNNAFADYTQTVLANSTYFRVTHYDDVVVHQPPSLMDFKHSGTEIWYSEYGYSMRYQECDYQPNQIKEYQDCANTFILKLTIESHMIYVGNSVKSCSINQPSGTLMSDLTYSGIQQISSNSTGNEIQNFLQY